MGTDRTKLPSTRSEVQSVEIMTGLVLGLLLFVSVRIGAWLVSESLGLTGQAYSQVSFWAQWAGVVAGAVVLVYWLVRARRRGL